MRSEIYEHKSNLTRLYPLLQGLAHGVVVQLKAQEGFWTRRDAFIKPLSFLRSASVVVLYALVDNPSTLFFTCSFPLTWTDCCSLLVLA